MSFYFPNVDPVYVYKRNVDAYISLQQSSKVVNGKVILKEIPDFQSAVVVKNASQVVLTGTTNATLLANQYRIDYSVGHIYFHTSLEGQNVTIDYKGTGYVSFPAERIWLETTGAQGEESLQDIVTRLKDTSVASLDTKVGSLVQLQTTNKTSVVAAVNENTTKLADMAQNTMANISQRMANNEAITIDCYGDSTYYGQISGSTGQVAIPAPLQLQNTLRSYFGNNNITVNNKGIAGNQTTNALRSFESEMALSTAQIVYVNYGLNDLSGSNPSGVSDPAISADQYKMNLTEFVRIARKYGKLIILESINVELANHSSSAFLFRIEGAQQFAAVSKQVAMEKNVPYIDQQYLTKKYLQTVTNVVTAFPDGIHPSREVYIQKGLNMALPLLNPIPIRKETIITAGTPGFQATSALRSTNNAGSKSGIFFFSDTSVRSIIYVDEPGLDIYISTVQYSNGSTSCNVKVDGNIVTNVSLNDAALTTSYAVDSEMLVIQDAVPGVHLIELENIAGSGRVGLFYIRSHKTRKQIPRYSSTVGDLPSSIGRVKVVEDLLVTNTTDSNNGEVMLDIPTSRTIAPIDVEIVAKLAKGDGITLFSKPFNDTGKPHAGLVLYLNNTTGVLRRAEGSGSGFTNVADIGAVDLSTATHRYRIVVTNSGVCEFYVNDISIGTYTLTKPHFGGFLGFYKNKVGVTRVEKVLIN